MVQESKTIGIVGAGASGCICAYNLLKSGLDVTLIDASSPLMTLLPTGGGRCNLAHAIFDFKELAQNYPRGEKFLYSVFSKFSTADTLLLFEELGIDTYIQGNGRIFPTSNSAKEVRDIILSKLKMLGAKFEIGQRVEAIFSLENGFKVKSKNSKYYFSDVVVAIGGKNGFLKGIDIKTVPFHPSLVGLNSNTDFPKGVVIKDVYSNDLRIKEDILFTHFGISGPLVYTISSLKAFNKLPYKLSFDLYPNEINLQEILNSNSHKEIKNILSKILPLNFVIYLLKELNIVPELVGSKIDGKTRDRILDKIHNFEVVVTSVNKGEETVSAGGYDLDEINSKTMEVKKYPHLYIIGECLNIYGLCGGFNLQNAWSTAFVASETIKSSC